MRGKGRDYVTLRVKRCTTSSASPKKKKKKKNVEEEMQCVIWNFPRIILAAFDAFQF